MIFILADTHGEMEIRKLKMLNLETPTERDVVIILGDFGLIWREEPNGEENFWLKWLNNKPYTTLFIDGNHDNHNALNDYPLVDIPNSNINGKFKKITDKVYYIPRGTVFEIDHLKFIGIGGAKSIEIDRKLRTEGKDWWPTELLSEKDKETILKNIEEHDDIDIILSHTAPESIFNKIEWRLDSIGGPEDDPTRLFLETIKENSKCSMWLMGHFHIDERIEMEECKYIFIYDSYVKIDSCWLY